jgi:protocatechuate 3,4-dioxygenase beta subunit
MKRILFVLFASTFVLCAAAQNPPNNGVIEGRIVREGTTEPVSNALVTLAPLGASTLSPEAAAAQVRQIEQVRRNAMIAGNPREATEAEVSSFSNSNGKPVYVLTNDTGRFTFTDVPPGRYTIRGERESYMAPRVNESYQSGFVKSVVVEVNKRTEPIEMELIPPGVMSGRVIDPQGQPAVNVSVNAYRVIISLERNGGETWFAGRAITTNDRGEYRLSGIPPGALWIAADPRPNGPQAAWERTFYGDVITPETATRIKVVTGGEVPNLDIHLKTRIGPFKITGTAINPFATLNPSTGLIDRSVSNFQLVKSSMSLINEGRPPYPNAIPASARPNGEFEIGNVAPGTYDLVASATDPATRQTFYGKTPVEVRNGDVSGVSLVISRNLSLKGQVEIRGTQAASIKPESLSIQLQSLGPLSGGGPPMKPDMNGNFSNDRLPEEKYRVLVNGLPQDGYIQDIRYGDASVFDDGFTLNPNSTLQVIVHSDGLTLKGSVRSTNGQPVAAATIALVPPQAQRQNPVRFKQATTDDKGTFTIRGVAPGQYTIFAWENIYNQAWLNTRYLDHYLARGRSITVGNTPPAEIQIEAIPTENYLEIWAR